MKSTMALIVILTMPACSGTVYTVHHPKEDQDGRIQGILFYGYKTSERLITLDRIRNPKTGEITHSSYVALGSPNYCKPQTIAEKITTPDYSETYAIQYHPALFETSSFGVTLDRGTLESVNSQSTPGTEQAIEAIKTIISMARPASQEPPTANSEQARKGLELTCSTAE
jgi:hypothetical protein